MADDQRVISPKKKKEEEKEHIRRSYNMLIKNSQRKITNLNEEFFRPEYLDEQRLSLKADIKQLKTEIKPLRKELEKLQETYDSYQSHKSSTTISELNFYELVAEEQKESSKLDIELAAARRQISDTAKIKLQYQWQTYMEEISNLRKSIQESKTLIEKRRNKIEEITKSEYANRIVEQRQMIADLQHTLELQQNVSNILKERSFALMKAAPINTLKKEVDRLTKKNEMLETIKMRKRNEYNKKYTELYYRSEDLKRKIKRKKEEKKQKAKKDAYFNSIEKKKQNSSQEIPFKFRPSLIVSKQPEEKPKKLPHLNQTNDIRRTKKFDSNLFDSETEVNFK